MKNTNYMIHGFVAIAALFLFAQCAGKANTTATTPEGSSNAASGANLRIAYVDIDTLLTKYDFWNDITGEMMKKEENVRATVNKQSRDLEKEMQEFQRKYENNAFVNQDRAQQEYNRVMKKQQDLEGLHNRLMGELSAENNKNGVVLRDSIDAFIKDYNKTKGYNFILSSGVLYSDPVYDITQEVVDGLNARYNAAGSKKVGEK